jgi:undecaprenyl-diphosphatase
VSLLAAALLGVVQGLTEFLPVSSSAHLILGRAFFGWDAERSFGLAFDVACHVGTLAAVLLFFRQDIGEMLAALPRALTASPGPVERRIRLIAIGTLPIVVAGALYSDEIEAALRTPAVAAVALLVGAGLLLVIERMSARTSGEEALTAGGALAIGAAQAVALVPGVSRSGATIATGMALGLRRDAAARFAFLMSIPAILAAAAKEGLELRHVTLGADALSLFAVGMVTSGVVGYFTVKYFIRFLVSHRLDVFAWYRVGLAAVTFVWLATR